MEGEAEFSVQTRDASPSNLLVKLPSFSLLSKKGIIEFESNEFEAGDYKWKMIIDLEENESGIVSKHVGVYLSLQPQAENPQAETNWEINAIFTFFLYNHISRNYLCFQGKAGRFNAVNTKCGFSKMISKKSLMDPKKGYLDVEGCCVFGAEVFVINPQSTIIQRVCLRKAPSRFKREWKLLDFSDTVCYSKEFQAGDQNWKALVYPKGNGSGEGRCTSIYAECVDCKNLAPNHQKHKTEIRFTIKTPSNINSRPQRSFSRRLNNSWYTPLSPDWGFAKFLPIDDMMDSTEGFLVDDCCFLQVEIFFPASV